MTSASQEHRANPSRRSSKQLAIYALFTGGVAIGCVPIFVRLSEVVRAPPRSGGCSCAAGFYGAVVPGAQKGGGKASREAVEYALMAAAGLFFAADLTVWHWSIKLTSVANATLLANFAPIFVALGGWLLYRQR